MLQVIAVGGAAAASLLREGVEALPLRANGGIGPELSHQQSRALNQRQLRPALVFWDSQSRQLNEAANQCMKQTSRHLHGFAVEQPWQHG